MHFLPRCRFCFALLLLMAAAIISANDVRATNQSQTIDSTKILIQYNGIATELDFEPPFSPSVDGLKASWRQRQLPPTVNIERPQQLPQNRAMAEPRVIWVDSSSTGGDGSEGTPFATIQAAIDDAVAGDAVVIRPGVYAISEPLVLKSEVAVVGEMVGEPDKVIIRSNSPSVVRCAYNSFLQDVTLESISPVIDPNDAIVFCDLGSPVFQNIIIDQPERVGFILQEMSGAVITNSFINAKDLYLNGTISLYLNTIIGDMRLANGFDLLTGYFDVDLNIIVGQVHINNLNFEAGASYITNNWILGRQGSNAFPAISMDQMHPQSKLFIANNTIAGVSGGIGISGSGEYSIINNIIAYSGVALNQDNFDGTVDFSHNLFWENQYNAAGLFSPIGTNGNIEADPRFVDLDLPDLHLLIDSPAIDAGINLDGYRFDIDLEPRRCDGNNDDVFTVDIGADEYAAGQCEEQTFPTPQPTMTPEPTNTPVPTQTLEPTPTNTATETATETPTETPTDLPPTATSTILPTETPTLTPTATPMPVPTASPTTSGTIVAPTATPTQGGTVILPLGNNVYLPLFLAQSNGIVRPTPAPTETPTPSATPLPTELAPTETATAPVPTATSTVTPTPDGLQFSGAPIDAEKGWHLEPDGRIVYQDTIVEPFPLSSSLGINDLSYSYHLHAATDEGIYRRNFPTARWQQVSDIAANYVAGWEHQSENLWIVPKGSPHEVWFRYSDEDNWETDFSLAGGKIKLLRMISPGAIRGPLLIGERDGQHIVWARGYGSGQSEWEEQFSYPGPVIADGYGLPASFASPSMVGTADGKIYTNLNGSWTVRDDFGVNNYPLLLSETEMSLIDLTTGDMTLYHRDGTDNNSPWNIAPLANVDLPPNVAQLPDGEPIKRVTANYAALYLSESGKLYSHESAPVEGVRFVTDSPVRTNFILESLPVADIVQLYSGAVLTWDSSSCSATENNFYRSSDHGVSWQIVNSEAARQPVAVARISNSVFANSCTGPTLSMDGGTTWKTPQNLNWPLNSGAEYILPIDVERFEGRLPFDWQVIYASGLGENDQPFVLKGTYDSDAQTVTTWDDITPIGFGKPTSIFAELNSSADRLYIADESTVWLSEDGGLTWHSRSAGLNGAQVRALITSNRNPTILAATDQGLFITKSSTSESAWMPVDNKITTKPISFEPSIVDGLFLNGEEYAYNIATELLPSQYDPPSATPTPSGTPNPTTIPAPTMTPTPTKTPTPMPTSTPTPNPIVCQPLLSDPGFEDQSGWRLYDTAYPGEYSSAQVLSGNQSLQLGIPVGAPNTFSYTTAYQSVTLPSDADSITLNGQLWRGGDSTGVDYQYVFVAVTGGSIESVVQGLSTSQIWEPITYDLTELRGKRIQVMLGVYNNGVGGQAVMYVDDMQIEVCKES